MEASVTEFMKLLTTTKHWPELLIERDQLL